MISDDDPFFLERSLHFEGKKCITWNNSGDDFFFLEITAFSGQKMHYLEQFQAMIFMFFGDLWILRTKSALPRKDKLVLNIHNFMTWFWHANCMTSLKGHCMPLVVLTDIPDKVFFDILLLYISVSHRLILILLFYHPNF